MLTARESCRAGRALIQGGDELVEPVIQLKDVRKVYVMGHEKIIALNNITLTFEREKIYCLLGTSGSGKSTLLNLIAGLEKPTKGSITIANRHIEKMSENQLAKFRQANIGFVFQSYNLLPTLTALENVTLPLIFKKIPKRVRIKRAKEMLKAVGLANRAKHKPSEMSGGQQQRVSIARAFINDPSIVFADEPTGNLDTKTTAEMMELITSIARNNKQTLIIVTHDLEISKYADTIIHIQDGMVDKIYDVQKNDEVLQTKENEQAGQVLQTQDSEQTGEVLQAQDNEQTGEVLQAQDNELIGEVLRTQESEPK
jgi:putative ABC transport system ATP-binding protein